MIGHTHKDIDAYFSHLSTNLKNHNLFVVADLMKAFMESQELSLMPEFIQEVVDFKSFVKGYIRDGPAKLIGLRDMHLFKFFMDDKGWSLMLYKESTVDLHWLPCNKPPDHLWKAYANNRPRISRRISKPVSFRHVWEEVSSPIGNMKKALEKANKAIEKKSVIKNGIYGYISFWECGMAKCQGFAKDFPPYVEY